MCGIGSKYEGCEGCEWFCDVCGEDDGSPHSLYQHILSVLEDNLDRYSQKEREIIASELVGELKAPRIFEECTVK